jgi:hypothetical protein
VVEPGPVQGGGTPKLMLGCRGFLTVGHRGDRREGGATGGRRAGRGRLAGEGGEAGQRRGGGQGLRRETKEGFTLPVDR